MLWVVSFALLTSAAINVFLVTRPAEISEIELWAASIATINIEERVEEP